MQIVLIQTVYPSDAPGKPKTALYEDFMKFTIQDSLCDLNRYVNACRANYHAGNAIKRTETSRVYWEAKKQKLKPITQYPVRIVYRWYSKNERMDIDNVAFAKKFINDGLVEAKVLENDSRKFVLAFEDHFFIDKKNPRIEIEINPIK